MLTKEEIKEIAELIAEAYDQAGRKLETATLITGDIEEAELIIDNRNEEEIN